MHPREQEIAEFVVLSRSSLLSLLDNSLYGTLFDSSKRAYLRHFRSSISMGVQLGQVAIYCRVSTDDQCCERQERDLRAFARRAGHRIVGVFKETASGAKNDRPERKKVMALDQARPQPVSTPQASCQLTAAAALDLLGSR
jgi:predicted site-specific integrase-resolvase